MSSTKINRSVDEAAAAAPRHQRTASTAALPRILAKIAAVNRRAERLGVPGFRYQVGAPRVLRLDDQGGLRYEEVVDISVSGEPVEISGYRFLGRIDFETGVVLVNCRPGDEIPPRYRSTTPYCDHCASKRARSSVFVFRRVGDQQHIQVGRSCLKDFLGHDPANVLSAASLWVALGEVFDDDAGEDRGGSPMARVQAVIEMAAAIIRLDNGAYRSNAWAHEDPARRVSTSADVSEQIFPPKHSPASCVIVPTEADTAHAQAAREWALESMAERAGRQQSDFEFNMVSLLSVDYVKPRRIGILVSLLGAFAKHLAEAVGRQKGVDAWVGVIGQRRTFAATFVGVISFDGTYGPCYIGRFQSSEGLIVYKGSSPFWPAELRAGELIEFVGTIKEHSDYKGAKQTLVQRVKLRNAAEDKAPACSAAP